MWLSFLGRMVARLVPLLLVAHPVSAQDEIRALDFGAEYAGIGYTNPPEHNPIAQLIPRLESGEVQLEFQSGRLHLDALLEELNIDPSSQILVYSGTSLQTQLISSETPRAIYFNDTTYVAWIPGSTALEIVTTDAAIGPVFYSLRAKRDTTPEFQRHTGTCLICHDTYNGGGGGVPLLMVKSMLTRKDGSMLGEMMDVTHTTPLEQRWGGWYVTGQQGSLVHRGNILVDNLDELANVDEASRSNLDTLDGRGYFDTDAYIRSTSDIVALMVLEHQVTVQNELTYVKFKAPAVLQRSGHPEAVDAASWDALPERAQTVLKKMLDRLTNALMFVDEAEFSDRITGTAGYEAWFEAQGPRDSQNRSLRDFDLEQRLFRYPLSYLIYSDEFDALPVYAKDYVYGAIASALEGGEMYGHLSPDERDAIKEILRETKPELSPYLTTE